MPFSITPSQPRRHLLGAGLVVLAVSLGLLLSACGATSQSSAPTSPTRALTPYLARAGEETGFSISGAPTLDSAASFATGDPNAKAEATRLRTEGFRAALIEHTSTAAGNGGVSFVLQLESHAAALSEEQSQLNEDITENSPATRITRAQVPTSEGFTAKGSSVVVANLLFVEGRCILLVGDEVNAGSDPSPPVLAGALKIYDRTKSSGGVCG